MRSSWLLHQGGLGLEAARCCQVPLNATGSDKNSYSSLTTGAEAGRAMTYSSGSIGDVL